MEENYFDKKVQLRRFNKMRFDYHQPAHGTKDTPLPKLSQIAIAAKQLCFQLSIRHARYN